MTTSNGFIFQVAAVLILALPGCTNSNQAPRPPWATDREVPRALRPWTQLQLHQATIASYWKTIACAFSK